MAAIDSPSTLTSLFSSLRSSSGQYTNVTTQAVRSASTVFGSGSHGILKNVLLTLHFLFPHELLPALDLLDRRLVKRVTLRPLRQLRQGTVDAETDETFDTETETLGKDAQLRIISSKPILEVFYVQSASAVQDSKSSSRSQVSGRFKNAWRGNAARAYYEVRLDSWNCTCPAFSQSQLKILLLPSIKTDMQGQSVPEPVRTVAETEADKNNLRPRHDGTTSDQPSHQFIFGGSTTNTGMPIPVCKHILAAAIATADPGVFANNIEIEEGSIEEFSGWAAGWGDH